MKNFCYVGKSQLVIFLIVLACYIGEGEAFAATQDPRSRQVRYYDDGHRLYEAISDDCTIAIGKMKRIGQPITDNALFNDKTIVFTPVTVEISDYFWGTPQSAEANLQFIHTAEVETHKHPDGPWTAWEEEPLVEGSTMLVVWWGERSKQVDLYKKPGWVVLATTSTEKIEQIKKIIEFHKASIERKASLSSIYLQALNQDSSSANLMVVGFFLSYMPRKGVYVADETSQILLFLLNSQFRNFDQSIYLWEVFLSMRAVLGKRSSASPPTCKKIMEGLVLAACSSDPKKAELAIESFVILDSFRSLKIKPDIFSLLTAGQRALLSKRYAYLVSAGKIRKTPSLESQPGIEKSK